ncbi:MAG: type 1 glutamine amidotransferase domain-containing protein [Bacteroidota bacterium]
MKTVIEKIIWLLLCAWCVSCQQRVPNTIENAQATNHQPSEKGKVLFVTSNAHFYGDTNLETTNHFPEIIFAHNELVAAGLTVDFVSPDGGAIPLGYIYSSDTITKKYLYDHTFMEQLRTTKSPGAIDASVYDAIYFTGGGSAMFTVPYNKVIQQLAMDIYEHGGLVTAICHGTAGITHLKTRDGNFLVSDKKITGFPDQFEDTTATYYQSFPFSIEKAVTANRGTFVYSEKGWDNFFVQDGRIITGQDPTSAEPVAQAILQTLHTKTIKTTKNEK